MVLSNRTLKYTVDLSQVPCHCNAALYFNKMPAYEAGELLDWYCDANYVGGIGCPEYDVIEANQYNIASNLHNCGWDGEWWVDCDGGGCGEDVWDVDSEAYGVGE